MSVVWFSVVDMFEDAVGVPTSGELAGLIAANHTELVEHECRVLLLAALWADAHDLDPTRSDYQPLIERACAWGGPGTPSVSEYCAIELGTLQGTGMIAARLLIADALDLRHRLPRLWRQVRAGQVRAWQARKVAQATHQLSFDAADEVDRAVSGYVGMLPWPRFAKVLTAAILTADPGRRRRTRTPGPDQRRRVRLRQRRRPENPDRPRRQRRHHLVHGHSEPARRHPRRRRRPRPRRRPPRQSHRPARPTRPRPATLDRPHHRPPTDPTRPDQTNPTPTRPPPTKPATTPSPTPPTPTNSATLRPPSPLALRRPSPPSLSALRPLSLSKGLEEVGPPQTPHPPTPPAPHPRYRRGANLFEALRQAQGA